MTEQRLAYDVLTDEEYERLLAVTPYANHHLMDASAHEVELPRDRATTAEVTRRMRFALAA